VTEGRALTRLVILDGEVWPAGSVPPAAVAKRIRNPQCWEPVESDPPLPWGPEGVPAIGTAGTPVVPAAPASGIPNLEEKTGDSAVVTARAGLPIGRDPAEASGQAFAGQQQDGDAVPAPPDGEQELHDRLAVEPEPDPAQQPALLSEPPRSGKGATTAAWRTYAQQFDVDVPAEADRGDIIALLKDDGHIQ
jgi:hypothetical protein